jgi:formylglycine-generating enzyme required for sulfatase activity
MIRNSIGMELVLISAGQFMMGTDQSDLDLLMELGIETGVLDQEHGPNEMPIHTVKISKPFYLSRLEVTQNQYEKIMEYNPSRWMAGAQPSNTSASTPSSAAGDYGDYPVDSVDFTQAEEFCKRLSELDTEKLAGRTYRLPTEAEWEYACRAGTGTAFNIGEFADPRKCNYADRKSNGAFRSSRGGTVPGGSYPPNTFGLFDMHGNVAEWCADDYVRDAYAHSAIVDPKVPATTGIPLGQVSADAHRVLRGGSCVDSDIACRSAFRGHGVPALALSYPTGFRVVCEVK